MRYACVWRWWGESVSGVEYNLGPTFSFFGLKRAERFATAAPMLLLSSSMSQSSSSSSSPHIWSANARGDFYVCSRVIAYKLWARMFVFSFRRCRLRMWVCVRTDFFPIVCAAATDAVAATDGIIFCPLWQREFVCASFFGSSVFVWRMRLRRCGRVSVYDILMFIKGKCF